MTLAMHGVLHDSEHCVSNGLTRLWAAGLGPAAAHSVSFAHSAAASMAMSSAAMLRRMAELFVQLSA